MSQYFSPHYMIAHSSMHAVLLGERPCLFWLDIQKITFELLSVTYTIPSRMHFHLFPQDTGVTVISHLQEKDECQKHFLYENILMGHCKKNNEYSMLKIIFKMSSLAIP